MLMGSVKRGIKINYYVCESCGEVYNTECLQSDKNSREYIKDMQCKACKNA